jgi:O-succinylbenzoic acid--CoA ligase
VVLNCKLTDEELERLIIHSGSKIILTHSEFKNRMSGLNKITFPLPYDTLSKIDPGITDADRNKTTLILYTSGTTGSPKGVMLSFNNLISSVESAGTFFNFNQNDRWLVSLPVYHIGGIQILIRSVVYGSAMIIPNSLRINDIIHAIKKFSPTQISLVPTVLSRLIEKDILPNPELKNVFLGGGPVNDELVKLAVIKGWNIIKVYGSTETSSMVTSVSVKDKPDKISSAGKPLGSNIISVIDVDGNPLPEKEYGEIVVEGDSIMQGYWINEEGTKKQLLNRKFFTGDLGFLDEDGFLFVDSRKDDLIISGGENIYPAEIEEVILGLSDVQQVCVLGLEDREWGQIVAAAIVIKKSSVLTQEKIIELLKSRIASFKIPKKLIFVDEIPKTPLGKVKRESIRKLF